VGKEVQVEALSEQENAETTIRSGIPWMKLKMENCSLMQCAIKRAQ
jgi:hypothetical protein